MAGKPKPFSYELPGQWNQAPVTLIFSEKIRHEGWGKRTIQRLNETWGHQENAVLRTWSWCKQGWLHSSNQTDCWLTTRDSTTVLLKETLIPFQLFVVASLILIVLQDLIHCSNICFVLWIDSVLAKKKNQIKNHIVGKQKCTVVWPIIISYYTGSIVVCKKCLWLWMACVKIIYITSIITSFQSKRDGML